MSIKSICINLSHISHQRLFISRCWNKWKIQRNVGATTWTVLKTPMLWIKHISNSKCHTIYCRTITLNKLNFLTIQYFAVRLICFLCHSWLFHRSFTSVKRNLIFSKIYGDALNVLNVAKGNYSYAPLHWNESAIEFIEKTEKRVRDFFETPVRLPSWVFYYNSSAC